MYEKIYHPNDTHTAKQMGSGGLAVLATPAVVSFMENAAYEHLQTLLTDTDTSVGTRMDIQHLLASSVNQAVTVRILTMDKHDRKYSFTLEAYVEDKLIATAQHTRFVVDIERFLKRLD